MLASLGSKALGSADALVEFPHGSKQQVTSLKRRQSFTAAPRLAEMTEKVADCMNQMEESRAKVRVCKATQTQLFSSSLQHIMDRCVFFNSML